MSAPSVAPVPSFKVFVGNLSFKTTEENLSKAFEVVGRVMSANIITSGTRSLGYGFVEFATEDLARKATSQLHKTEMDGRTINVELARPRSEPRQPRERTRRPPRRQNDASEVNRREPNLDNEKREPSKTTLFVANLPFSVTDEDLKKIFEGFHVKEAHVVRSAPRNRSKGYGFVELANQEEQQKALNAVDKKVVSARELVVRVAMSEMKKDAFVPQGGQPGSGSSSPPPAASPPAGAAAGTPAAGAHAKAKNK